MGILCCSSGHGQLFTHLWVNDVARDAQQREEQEEATVELHDMPTTVSDQAILMHVPVAKKGLTRYKAMPMSDIWLNLCGAEYSKVDTIPTPMFTENLNIDASKILVRTFPETS